MTSTAYVYVIFRLDGSPCYVGKGTGHRWLQHQSESAHSKLLLRLFRKAREIGKELPRVKVRENLSHEQACEIEGALIAAIGRRCDGGPLLNRTLGGEGLRGYSHKPETKAKISAANKGKLVSAETRKKMSDAAKRPKPWATGESGEKRRAAIRATTLAFWEGRRQQGLPLTHRGEAGHRKHSAALLARASRKRQQERQVG